MSEPIEDPYAGNPGGSAARANEGAGERRSKRGAPGEVRSEAMHFAQRLHDLGATPEEIDPVLDSWDDLEDDATFVGEGEAPAWTAAYRTQLVSAPDAVLREMIATARDEYSYANTTEAESAAEKQRAQDKTLEAQAGDVIGGSVASVLEWVGDDADRARIALELETAPGQGAARKTLVGPLTDISGQVPSTEATMDGSPGPGTQLGPEGMAPVAQEAPEAADGPQEPADGPTASNTGG